MNEIMPREPLFGEPKPKRRKPAKKQRMAPPLLGAWPQVQKLSP